MAGSNGAEYSTDAMYMTQFALEPAANARMLPIVETVRRLLTGSSFRHMIDHFHVREIDGRQLIVTLFVNAPSEVEAMVVGRLVNADLVVSLSGEQPYG
jgi:hypothetical protein